MCDCSSHKNRAQGYSHTHRRALPPHIEHVALYCEPSLTVLLGVSEALKHSYNSNLQGFCDVVCVCVCVQVYALKREDVERELTFAGLVVISCPLKEDSKRNVRCLHDSSHHVSIHTLTPSLPHPHTLPLSTPVCPHITHTFVVQASTHSHTNTHTCTVHFTHTLTPSHHRL